MMPRTIPGRFSYRHSYLGMAAALLFAASAIVVAIPQKPLLLKQLSAPLVYSFLLVFLLFCGAEILNFNDARRLEEYRYSYDSSGLYRERALVIRWDEVTSITFVTELKKDVIPAKHDAVWTPYFNLFRDFSVPELTRKIRESRILFFRQKTPGKKADLTIQTTSFTPAFKHIYNHFRELTSYLGLDVEYEFVRLLPQDEEEDEDKAT